MAVVRYVVLAALVVWLGGTINALAGNVYRQLNFVAYACGAAILIGLLIMKFVGPPPHGFMIRTLIVVGMVAVAAFAAMRGESPALLTIDLILGMTLLSWYARE